MFGAEESAIQELIAGVKQGYLVQAHTHEVDECGCPCMGDVVAAFLIGAGEDALPLDDARTLLSLDMRINETESLMSRIGGGQHVLQLNAFATRFRRAERAGSRKLPLST